MAQRLTGTVTFLFTDVEFTDVEGSTRLLQRLGDDYARVLGEHQALLRAAFAAHGGAEVDTQFLTLAWRLGNLGTIALRRGEVSRAETLGRESLALYRTVGDPRQCAEGLEYLARTAGTAGNGARAARLLGGAAARCETLGAPQPPGEREELEHDVAAARATLGEEAWAAAFAAGRALALEQAIAEALGEAG